MDISVIVPVRNDAARLNRCLASLKAIRHGKDLEVIVGDNGSTDASAEVASRAGARVLLLPDVNVAAVRNAAARAASGSLIAFVDADHELGDGWIDAARETMRDPVVGAAGAKYTTPADGTWVQRMYGLLRGRTTGVAETDWLGSGNMVVRRAAFEKVGGFDESLEACEDVDLCRRIRGAGLKIVGDERMRSVHHGDPPTLGALFRAERWRGRDNLRVSLRGSLHLRDMPSVIIPVLSLFALMTLALSPILGSIVGRSGTRLAIAALGLILLLGAMRAWRMAGHGRGELSVLGFAQAFVAALVYDTARAAALVTRASHHR